ncbi:STAS domain-containing protein [Nonomuraea sp. bgisy101]|uniref:STAS domain-containing protein n=1 Tax=Nonomuraea sp. bgisy101 TaxID=3413784 RepID=UPI003D71D966
MQRLKVICTDQRDRVVVSPDGEIDMATAEHLRSQLVGAVVNRIGSAPVLEVDMSQVSFMDCSGLGVLISFKNSLVRAGGDLALTNVPACVDRVLACLGLDHLLEARAEQPPQLRRAQSAPSRSTQSRAPDGAGPADTPALAAVVPLQADRPPGRIRLDSGGRQAI